MILLESFSIIRHQIFHNCCLVERTHPSFFCPFKSFSCNLPNLGTASWPSANSIAIVKSFIAIKIWKSGFKSPDNTFLGSLYSIVLGLQQLYSSNQPLNQHRGLQNLPVIASLQLQRYLSSPCNYLPILP